MASGVENLQHNRRASTNTEVMQGVPKAARIGEQFGIALEAIFHLAVPYASSTCAQCVEARAPCFLALVPPPLLRREERGHAHRQGKHLWTPHARHGAWAAQLQTVAA
eukprot:scaffold27982_cov31-Tisochrysis_lutea.AAC.15